MTTKEAAGTRGRGNGQERVQEIIAQAASAQDASVVRDRYGYRINGEFYRRVTTMLGGLPKPWLGTWAAKCVAEFAVKHKSDWANLPDTDAVKMLKGVPWSKRDDAGDRGTAVHMTIEAIIHGQPIPDTLKTDDELGCAIAVESFLKCRASKVLASELTVFSPKHGYAGTLDLWDLCDGAFWVLDWKTSADVYAEHAVQLTAYQHGEFAIVNKQAVSDEKWTGKIIPWGPDKVDRMGVVHVKPDGAILYPVRATDRLWTVFRAASHVKLWQSDVDSYAGKQPKERVFDDPITMDKGDA